MEHLRTDELCPVAESMVYHRTKGEEEHLEELGAILYERLQDWPGVSCVDPVEGSGVVRSCVSSADTFVKTGHIVMSSVKRASVLLEAWACRSLPGSRGGQAGVGFILCRVCPVDGVLEYSRGSSWVYRGVSTGVIIAHARTDGSRVAVVDRRIHGTRSEDRGVHSL